jgi:signal transduction histidine kinase
MRASEEERARWARELHDETLQELGALKVVLDAARQTADAERMGSTIESAVGQIELSIRNLQALITELRPAALDQIGLVPALEALVKRVGATSGMHVDAEIKLGRDAPRLHPEVERTVYRVIQESLTNATKHAEAANVQVELDLEDGAVTLCVCDDGKGFDTQGISAGFGLVGMQDRVSLVGGSMQVDSEPGAGTTVRGQVPARYLDDATAAVPAGNEPEQLAG